MTLAITLKQPWATLVVRGLQCAEERSWSTTHRGLLLIHAGRELDPDATSEQVELAAPLVFGAIVGHVELHDVEGRPGAYRWLLRDPHELAEPIPARGLPGLWEVEL